MDLSSAQLATNRCDSTRADGSVCLDNVQSNNTAAISCGVYFMRMIDWWMPMIEGNSVYIIEDRNGWNGTMVTIVLVRVR